MVFETERLRVRHFSPDDAPLVLELLNDPLWIRFIGDRNVHSLDAARSYLDKPIRSYAEHGYGLYHVARKDDGEALGMCGLVKRDNLPDADIGFAFLERFRGHGYALEAARGTLAHARGALRLKRIIAVVTPANTRSASLLQKLGFVRERSTAWNGNDKDIIDLWASDPEELRFERVAGGHRYRALIGSDEVAFAEVDPIGKKSLLIKHTEVLPDFEGRGIGGKLVKHMLDEARSEGRSVIPICPYAAQYIKRHPEYLENVREDYRGAMR